MSGRSHLSKVKQAAGSLRAALLARDGREDSVGVQSITLDYPVRPIPRHGYDKPAHKHLEERIAAGREAYADQLRAFAGLRDHLLAIPWATDDPAQPFWHNGWYQGLDAVALYSFIALERPSRLIEVGSGNSTKFARRAIEDHATGTHLTSIDPVPRSEVDGLCDILLRRPMEDADLDIFDALEAGDILFLDGSHRVFMNSDATVFFTEVLPSLPAGVLVHVHDCFLPWDYPPQIAEWYWSEQYLLACWLLAGSSLEVVMPNFYVSTQPDLHHLLDPVFDDFVWSAAATNGTGFWLRTTADGQAHRP